MHKMTEENVGAALAGESQAHIRYLNFAAQAEKDGKPNVARLFAAAAFSEQMHASAHLRVIGGVKGTSDNLAAAGGGENFEVEEMYPAYIAVAEAQKEPDAKKSFHRAIEAEKIHHGLYQRAKQAVDGGKDFQIGEIWVCGCCGFTMEGNPPDKCPICGADKSMFKKF